MTGRVWLTVPLIFVAALSAASGEVAPPPAPCVPAAQPSSLDYLALASMAYAQRPLAMAAYRPQAQGSPPKPRDN